MPLRFRAVVPYTLPGVLALIGWWWYISRKKDRLISHDGPAATSSDVPLKASPSESSNGLVEKSTVSPTNTTEPPSHRPPKVVSQTEPENLSQNHIQPPLEQSCQDAAHQLGAIRQEVDKAPVTTHPPSCDEGSLQVSPKDHEDLEQSPASTLAPEADRPVNGNPSTTSQDLEDVEEVVLTCWSNKVTHSSPTATHISDAERPEPEGEVAGYQSAASTKNDGFANTPAKGQTSAEADSLETPTSVQDFHQNVLTSTPTSPDLSSTAVTTVQDANIQVHNSCREDQDLELLAAGLITEVISAATQEVLGVTSLQAAENSPPGPGGSRLCSQQELKETRRQPQHPSSTSSQVGRESGAPEAAPMEEQGMTNGCSSASTWESEVGHGVLQTANGQRGYWPKTEAAEQNTPLPNTKQKGDEAATTAEDSACSTCHSEDGVSSEDLQHSVFDNKSDMFQVTDLSAKEVMPIQSLVETASEAMVLALTEDNSVESVYDVKRLDGMGLRNGAHGTCEVETDQSGGEFVKLESGVILQVGFV